MGEVGARDDERPPPREDLGQGGSEAAGQRGVRLADDHRNDLCLGKEDLDERHLDLDRVLAGVRALIGRAIGVRRDQRRDGLPVHRGCPQGGPETVARVEGDLPEAGGGMVRSEDDDDIVGPAPDLAVAVGADLAGEDVAGMGDDDGEGLFHQRRLGVFHELIDGEFQDGRRFGVEFSGHGGRADVAPSSSRLAGHGEPQAQDDKRQTDVHERHGGSPFAASQLQTPAIRPRQKAQRPSLMFISAIKNPVRLITVFPQEGQVV